MFGKSIVERWKARAAIKVVPQNPLIEAARQHLRTVLLDSTSGLGKHFSEEGKQGLISECLADIERQLASENPLQSVRMRTIEYMLLAAKFDVLVSQPPTAFRGISGELRPRIPELSMADEDLRDFFQDLGCLGTSFDEMCDAVLMRCWVMQTYINAYNTVRCGLGDYDADKTKDWLRPCYTSLCIWQENTYRACIGLAPVISEANPDIRALMHSAWMNRAQEGHKHLRLSWERSWEDTFGEPSPYAGLAL